LPLAERYAGWLAGAGVERGLIGPREVPRLWERHLLNCAVLGEVLPASAKVIDVGSGAGLPGLVLALARPDLRITLLEPLERRVTFLNEVVGDLGLDGQVGVTRGRAEDRGVRHELGGADWVTARAVAPLDRLVRWSLPLLAPGGRLLALKGARAADEVAASRSVLRSAGAGRVDVRSLGGSVLDQPTWVVVVERSDRDSVRGREKRTR
jgi:16S rRNA (guanine527-N7)-methyltransferase